MQSFENQFNYFYFFDSPVTKIVPNTLNKQNQFIETLMIQKTHYKWASILN